MLRLPRQLTPKAITRVQSRGAVRAGVHLPRTRGASFGASGPFSRSPALRRSRARAQAACHRVPSRGSRGPCPAWSLLAGQGPSRSVAGRPGGTGGGASARRVALRGVAESLAGAGPARWAPGAPGPPGGRAAPLRHPGCRAGPAGCTRAPQLPRASARSGHGRLEGVGAQLRRVPHGRRQGARGRGPQPCALSPAAEPGPARPDPTRGRPAPLPLGPGRLAAPATSEAFWAFSAP